MIPAAREVGDYLRSRIAARELDYWLWMGALAFCALVLARVYILADPAAFAIVVGGCVFVTSVAAVPVLWADRRDDRKRIARLERDLKARVEELALADEVIASLAADAAQAPVPYVPVVAPRLRIVEQLRPTHDALPVADGHFPVHTEIHDHDIEALMRATEEN